MIMLQQIISSFKVKRLSNTLEYAVKDYPNAMPMLIMQPDSASSEEFYRWDRLNFNAVRWSFSKYGARRANCKIKELRQLIEEKNINSYEVELNQVVGLSNSKNNLSSVGNLDEFAIKYCSNYINDLSENRLNEMLSHKEIRIIHAEAYGDFFKRFSWREGIFLINNGGSHHFSAARYIAARLNKKIILKGRMVDCKLSKFAIERLMDKYTIFLIEKNMYLKGSLLEYFKNTRNSFIHLETDLIMNVPGDFLIIENENEIIINAFKENNFFDVGQYLSLRS